MALPSSAHQALLSSGPAWRPNTSSMPTSRAQPMGRLRRSCAYSPSTWSRSTRASMAGLGGSSAAEVSGAAIAVQPGLGGSGPSARCSSCTAWARLRAPSRSKI